MSIEVGVTKARWPVIMVVTFAVIWCISPR